MLRAQQTLTVADGTVTNANVPIYGYMCDNYIRSQVIYPEPMLQSMMGGYITSIKFYFDAVPEANWTSTFSVELGTASSPFFSSSWDGAVTTPVYTGLVTIENGAMTITLEDPFLYSGGNLLFEIHSLTKGIWKQAEFVGMTSNSGSAFGYDNGAVSAITSPTVQNFIPKVTFTYSNQPILCHNLSSMTVSNISAQSAGTES